ncbi:MAG: hypothetical protein KC656_27215, partial [Myxococcales bacterium]|nr:hypothetical protein [Myxococcales bacterium]
GESRYKLRWRERTPEGGWRSRSETLEGSRLERDRRVVEIREALASRGTADPPSAIRAPANLLEGMLEMTRQREVDGRYSAKTAQTYTSYARRIAGHLHAIARIPHDGVLPATLLSRETFAHIKERDAQLGIGQSVRYASVRLLLDTWEWMADDPARWAHVPPPPLGRTRRDYLTRTARYGRTVAPRLEHVDACILSLPPRTSQSTRIAAVIMRFTGLRASQVFGIHAEDLDVGAATLRVREGKGVLERADQRVVPLAPSLLMEPMVRGWLACFESGPLFPSRPHTSRKGRGARRKLPTETFKHAWEASGAPEHVWRPPGRRNSRPEHAFRAAFQAFLKDERVAGDVIDFLVGHHPHGPEALRDRHYGRDLFEHARAAVGLLPPLHASRE